MNPISLANQCCIICCADTGKLVFLKEQKRGISECFSNLFSIKNLSNKDATIGFCAECTDQLVSLKTLKKHVDELERELKEKAESSKEQFGARGELLPDYREIRKGMLGTENGTKPEDVIKKRELNVRNKEPRNHQVRDNEKPKEKLKPSSDSENAVSSSPSEYECEQAETDDTTMSIKQEPRRKALRKTRNYKVAKNTVTILEVKMERVGDGTCFSCSLCSSILPNNKRVMQRHVARLHSQLYSCSFPTCDKSFSTKHSLERHVRSVHKPKGKAAPGPSSSSLSIHNCPVCERPFSDLRNMNRHKWTHFSEQDKKEAKERGEKVPVEFSEKKFQCDLCAHFFLSRALLKLHQGRKHVSREERQNERGLCPLCGTPVLNVEDHIKRTHGEKAVNKMYACGNCNKRFASSGAVIRHKKLAHKV